MARIIDSSAAERPVPTSPRELRTIPYPTISESGAIGKGLESLGSSIVSSTNEIYHAQKIEEERINTLSAENATNALRNKALDLSIGDNGFTKLKGQDAVDKPILTDYTKQFDDARISIAATLTNDAQREKFTQRADLTALQYKESILRHLAREKDTFALQSYTGTLKAESNMASVQWDSPNDVGVSIERVKNAAAELDDNLGSHTDVRADRMKTAVGVVHEGVIQGALAANDYDYANQWLQMHKDEIDPVEQLKLQRQIKTTAMPVQAKQDAMSILQKDMANGVDMNATQVRAHIGQWMKEANDIADTKYPNDPIYRDLVQNQLSSYTNRIATAQAAQERNARNDVLSAVIMPLPNGEKISDLNQLLANPNMKAKWGMMEPTEQMGILQVLQHNSKGMDPPETIEALNKYHEMRGMAVNDPAGFQKAMQDDFDKLGHTLPRALFLQLINQDTAIDKNDAKALSTSQAANRIHSLTDGMLQQAGFKLPKGKDEKRQDVMDAYQSWTSRMLDSVQEFQEQNKRKPNDIELRELAKRQLQQGYETGTGHTWFGYTWGVKKVRSFQEEDTGKFSIPAPVDDAKQISDAFNKTFGRQPSQQEIDQWYAARLRQK